jgi:alpha-D-xyloside xylohydrolase
MTFDATAFIRLDALQALDRSASGLSLATSTGDILEVSATGPGVFRIRVGSNTRPDYGLVVGRTKACTVAQGEGGSWKLRRRRFCAGNHAGAASLPAVVSRRACSRNRSPTSTFAAGRGFPRSAAGARADTGPPRWHSHRAKPCTASAKKFGPLNKRGQIVHSHVADALGVNTGLAYKNAPFAWSPGTGKGAWGMFVNTPASVTHGVGHPDWSHRSYVIDLQDEALDLFLFAADAPAGILDLYTQLTGRPAPVPTWSLGLWVSRAYYKTPQEAAEVAAKLAGHRIPCDVLTLDGRAAWNVETRFDFEWDPDRFPDPRAALAAIKQNHLRVCVWEYPYVSVHSPLFTDLATRGYLLTNRDGDPYVFGWDTSPGTSPFGKVLTPLPESGIVDFTHPGAFVWWRDAHEALFAAGVDVIKSDFGEQVPRRRRRLQWRQRPPPAQRLSAAVQQVRARGDGEIPARQEFPSHGVGTRGLDRQPALSDPVGRRSAKRLGRPGRVDSRRVVVGHERRAVSQLRHRRLLRVAAADGRALPALVASHGVQLAHPRARASVSASRGRSGPKRRASRGNGWRSAIG